jgi:FAD/FMN-containing dehydrogenase
MTRTASQLSPARIDDLRRRFRGALVLPGDADYDEARSIWNGAIDRHPWVIARCTSPDDVRAALAFARTHDLPIAVRGGGHGVAGTAVCDDGVVIDCSPMKGIAVDPAARRARVGAGVLWGELDRETQAFGLATTGGIVTHTGVAGLTLGGGIGWLMRRFGATVDNLRSVDLVTVDGEAITASNDEHPDLFWGMRGAGANFGVVTSFEFELHEMGPTVLGGPIVFPMAQAAEVLRRYREWIADAPDELMTIVNLRRAPAAPFLPQDLHGVPTCTIAVCWCGDLDAGERVLQPLRSFGTPLIDLIVAKPYLEHQATFDPTVIPGWRYYWKSCELPALDDAVIEAMVTSSEAITSSRSYSVTFQLGGAVGRVDEDAMAYAHRDAGHNININAVWTEEETDPSAHMAWARSYFDRVEPHSPGVYVNFLGDEGADRVRAAYGDATFERLVALKRRYDPDNVLRLNQNIPPAP